MSENSLAGFRVLVTRPADQSDELVAAIENSGGEAIRFPVIRILGRDPKIVAGEFAILPTPDIVIFVSSNAAEHGLPAVRDCGARLAAIGPATSAAISATGARVDIAPSNGFDSEQLLQHPELQNVNGKTVLIVRGKSGRELLRDTLRERGADVSYLAVYDRERNTIPAAEVAKLDDAWRNGRIDCVTVMSVETLENLLLLLPAASLEALRKTPLVAPGERVIQTVMELVPGIPAIQASGPRAADILNALKDLRHSGQN
jgi:uroporphyrinogen-III synthase